MKAHIKQKDPSPNQQQLYEESYRRIAEVAIELEEWATSELRVNEVPAAEVILYALARATDATLMSIARRSGTKLPREQSIEGYAVEKMSLIAQQLDARGIDRLGEEQEDSDDQTD